MTLLISSLQDFNQNAIIQIHSAGFLPPGGRLKKKRKNFGEKPPQDALLGKEFLCV